MDRTVVERASAFKKDVLIVDGEWETVARVVRVKFITVFRRPGPNPAADHYFNYGVRVYVKSFLSCADISLLRNSHKT